MTFIDFCSGIGGGRLGLEQNGLKCIGFSEINMADKFRENYCLFVVKNLQEKPCENLFFNPLQKFDLKQIRQEITQISYQGAIDE